MATYDLFTFSDFGKYTKLKLIESSKHSFVTKPSEIKKFLDQYVIGQEEAKRALSVVLSNHMAALLYNSSGAGRLNRTNLLLTGSSGSGKTLLVETAARYLESEVLTVDISQFTQSGYKGRDTTEMLEDLVNLCGGDTELAERSIIFIDEFDKISTLNDPDHGVSTTGVQHTLLKMVEGMETSVTIKRGAVSLNTHNILFVFGGAFTDFSESKTKPRKSIGFTSTDKPIEEFKMDQESLIEAGFCRELVGRIGHITTLKPLSKTDLRNIITEPRDSVLNQMKILGKIRNVDLSLSESEIDDIVEEAVKLGTGARALRVITEKKLFDKMYI